jgi:subtilase family serine protease
MGKRQYRRPFRRAGVAAAAVAGLAGLLGTPVFSGAADAAMGTRVTLPQSMVAAPAGASIVGGLSATATLHVEVSLKVPDPQALQSFVDAVSTPGSPTYHRYLARGQFADRFGPSAEAAGAVRSWLASEGLKVGPTSANGLLVPVTGTAGQVAAAFGTTLSDVRLGSGVTDYLATKAPSVVASVAGSVEGVLGLDDLPQVALPRPPGPGSARRAGPATGGREPTPAEGGSSDAIPAVPATTPSGVPVPTACNDAVIDAGGGADAGWTQSAIAGLYGFSTLYDQGRLGYGQTIALAEVDPHSDGEIATFEQCYGITTPVTRVEVDGGTGTPAQDQIGEAAMDIEQVAALAPGSSILTYEGPNSGNGPTDIFDAIANDDRAQVVSASLGACESVITSTDAATEAAIFAQMAAQGQTVAVGTGDTGSEGCGNTPSSLAVNDPATQPDVLAVGGTAMLLGEFGTADQYAWNDCYVPYFGGANTPGCADSAPIGINPGAGTGGISSLWPMPSWQQDAGNGTVNAYSSHAPCGAPAGSYCREVPDVSALADTMAGYTIYIDQTQLPTPVGVELTPGWTRDAGTSASTPLWAALLADVNQGCAAPLGMVDPALYRLAAASSGAFTDVTTGNNDYTDTNGGAYPATAGYDLATGWGTPNGGPLAEGLQPAGGCPSLTGLSANHSMTAGGGTLVISGDDLQDATAVAIGSVDAPIVSDNGSSITVEIPPAPAGIDDVTVTTDNGTSAVTSLAQFTYTDQGYWEVGGDGGIFAFGDATFDGSMGGQPLNAPIVGLAATPDGHGYWEVAADGGIFAFGDAPFYGSMGGQHLNAPIVGITAAPDGQGMASNGAASGGYWEVAADGGIFAFGDAAFDGSMGGQHLNEPVVGISTTNDGDGYWEVAADGGIFAFGDATFDGSVGGTRLVKPVVGMTS